MVNEKSPIPDEESTDLAPLDEPVGQQVGPYRLLEKLGEGGMGEVWRAEQDTPRRQVAVKVIKRGMDTKQVIARFEVERQALALMDHPYIARVYDAGETPEGRPYFAMELVRGEPITTYCDRNCLRTRERLELFSLVCEGVQHAHHKAIIHRDLKPSNVLVTVGDEDAPGPKIIDFGVAKATNQHLTERTLFTELGQLIGTPEYMSPEQAEMTGTDIDTRTDVYSLGVLLYELLAGALPFDPKELRRGGLLEIQRRIREEEPPKPSTRVSRLGDTSTRVAAQRNTESSALVRRLQGDLDWIVIKSLEKDRTRRYASASDLAADIARHLAHQPIDARPPSASYRSLKFVRRHRLGVAAAAAVVLALIVAVVGTSAGLVRARAEAERANNEARTAKAVVHFLISSFRDADPQHSRSGEVTARDILAAGRERIEDEFGEEPEVRAPLLAAMGGAYGGLQDFEEAEPLLLEALRLQEERLGPDHPDLVSTLHDLADAVGYGGKGGDAVSLHERALRIQEETHGPDHPVVADSLLRLSLFGHFPDREERLQRAISIHEAQTPPLSVERAGALSALGDFYSDAGRLEESERAYEEAILLLEKARGNDAMELVEPLTMLGGIQANQGKTEEGLALSRRALSIAELVRGADHPYTAWARHIVAVALHRMGEYEEAESLYRQVLDIVEATFAPASLFKLTALVNIGLVYMDQGELEQANEVFQRTHTLLVETRGEKSPRLSDLRSQWGLLHLMAGRPEEAKRLFALAFRGSRRLSDPSLKPAIEAYAQLLRDSGRLSEAEALLGRMKEAQ